MRSRKREWKWLNTPAPNLDLLGIRGLEGSPRPRARIIRANFTNQVFHRVPGFATLAGQPGFSQFTSRIGPLNLTGFFEKPDEMDSRVEAVAIVVAVR